MKAPNPAEPRLARAHATGPAPEAIAELVAALRHDLAGQDPRAVIYFASSNYRPDDLARPLCDSFPRAAVLGCSTAGEFTDHVNATGGITAVALPSGVLHRAVAALGDLQRDVEAGTIAAVRAVEAAWGAPLRDLDPDHHVGLLLVDGMHGSEETVNETLGNAAPLLDVVGGSAGDDLAFTQTWVAVGDQISYHGLALLVCETAVDYQVVKTCSFTASGRRLRITGADLQSRTVSSFDGRPAAAAYADAVGIPAHALDAQVWSKHPVGLMIGGQPWIRSPQAVTPDGSIAFYAQIRPGMEVEVMNPTDLIADTAAVLADARTQLRGKVSGAVLFNCILRRLELDDGRSAAFVAALDGTPAAGFHTYGESWLGHVNQTLTGIVFGGTATS